MMGTELLREQFNQMQNEQKIRLEKLKQKKMMMNNQLKTSLTNNQNTENQITLNDFDDELDEMTKNNDMDNDLFSKFNQIDNLDSSDDENQKNKPFARSPNPNGNVKKKDYKILVKKNQVKTNENVKSNKLMESSSFDGINSVRESLSINDRLREIKDENGRLRKLLAEREYENNYLKKKIEEEKLLVAAGPIGNDVAATKIVELSKKVRELNAQLESEKTKTKQLAKNNKDLEAKIEILKSNNENNSKTNNNKNRNDSEDDLESDENSEKKVSLTKENKDLKENLYQTSHKMLELKTQNEILKQELKKTQKALEKEVGENVDVKQIISGQSNWKGRQQQIRMLQTKVNELKQQMADNRSSQMLLDQDEFSEENTFMKAPGSTANSSVVPRSAAQMSIMSGSVYGSTINSGISRTNNNSLRFRFDRDKREQLEKLKHDYESIENELNSMKEKLEASKARNKVLTNENKTFKEQVKTLLEKGKHDDELVEALMKKQNQLKQLLEDLNYQNDKVAKDLEEKSKEVTIKNMQEKNTIEQMKLVIAEKESKIKQLEADLTKLKETNTNNNDLIHEVGVKSPINQQQRQVSFINNEPLEKEMHPSRHSIRSANTAKTSRPNSGPATASTSNTLNAKLIEDKKDKHIDYKLEYSELKTLFKTSEIERLRLMDLVKTMQKRMDENNEKSIESENKLNEQRRRCANLEKQIEKLRLNQNVNSINKNKSAVQSNVNNQSISIDQYKIEELETSLLIQKDENDALKAALKSTLEAKEEDLRLYVEMLESTKRVYLDGLKQYKQIATNEG